MRIIRASEIGTYLFCRRAWWYTMQGVPSENRQELAGGSAFHHRHGRQVVRVGLIRLVAWLILLAALTLLVIGLTTQLLNLG